MEGQSVTDGFHFSVSDMDNNRVDNQVFTITVTPVENPPHIIAFADLITVNSSQINKYQGLGKAGILGNVAKGFWPRWATKFFPQSIWAEIIDSLWLSL